VPARPILLRRRGEGQAQAIEMIEHVGHRRTAAGSQRAKLVLADVDDDLGHRPGGGRQVQHLVSPSSLTTGKHHV
jgi:hypothetical protein